MCDNEKLRQLEKLKDILPYDCMGDLSVYLKPTEPKRKEEGDENEHSNSRP
jgi:hypothetical protein